MRSQFSVNQRKKEREVSVLLLSWDFCPKNTWAQLSMEYFLEFQIIEHCIISNASKVLRKISRIFSFPYKDTIQFEVCPCFLVGRSPIEPSCPILPFPPCFLPIRETINSSSSSLGIEIVEEALSPPPDPKTEPGHCVAPRKENSSASPLNVGNRGISKYTCLGCWAVTN